MDAFVLATAVAVAGWTCLSPCAEARADEPPPPSGTSASSDARPDPDRASNDDSVHRPRFGAVAGLGFPRPLSIEALIKLDDYVAVGGEYGVLPSITVDGVETTLSSFAADGRIFPFRNAFYVGLRAGRQHVGAETGVSVESLGALNETLALDSWFLNPRIGVLWTAASGLTVGAEIGIQIPLSSDITSSLPLAYAPEAEAERAVNTFGKSVLPTINLLQLDFLF
jgi:hypothetical protein